MYRNRLQKPENGAGEAMQPPKIGFSKKKSTILPTKYSAFLVENSGIEPLTSCKMCIRDSNNITPARGNVKGGSGIHAGHEAAGVVDADGDGVAIYLGPTYVSFPIKIDGAFIIVLIKFFK